MRNCFFQYRSNAAAEANRLLLIVTDLAQRFHKTTFSVTEKHLGYRCAVSPLAVDLFGNGMPAPAAPDSQRDDNPRLFNTRCDSDLIAIVDPCGFIRPTLTASTVGRQQGESLLARTVRLRRSQSV